MTYQEIIEDVRFATRTDPSAYPDKDILRYIRRGLDRALQIIFETDDRYLFDDKNHEGLPIAYFDINQEQKNYEVLTDEYGNNLLSIMYLSYLNDNGNYERLEQSDAGNEHFETQAKGKPRKFDVIENTVILDRLPDFSRERGLKVWFERGMAYPDDDLTQSPGIAEHLHEYISLWPTYKYEKAHGMDGYRDTWQEIKDFERNLADYYANRSESNTRLSMRYVSAE